MPNLDERHCARPIPSPPLPCYTTCMTNRATLLILAALLAATAPARAGFEDCVSSLRSHASAKGVSAATFTAATSGLQPNMEILGFLDAQPEFKTPIWDYLSGLVDDERVAEGRSKLSEYSGAFRQAESRYGVDAATIAAVWGVESDFGKGFGKRPIVQSLATLSCFGRRQPFFRGQFVAALEILQRGDVRAEDFRGSWAGAFGHTQFIPTTFLGYAVDMDGDGRRDVIGSVPDALGSTANYLAKSGWKSGRPWGFEVRLPEGYSGPSGRTNKQAMSSWAARGITRLDGRGLGEGHAGLLLPAGPRGPAFLVTHNFDAIYAYNAAESYGLAIALLSDRLRGGAGMQTPWPNGDRGLSRAERRELQSLLASRGYDIGNADGALGAKSRKAIGEYQDSIGMERNGGASGRLLEALRKGR